MVGRGIAGSVVAPGTLNTGHLRRLNWSNRRLSRASNLHTRVHTCTERWRKEFEIPGSGPLSGTGWADLASVFGRTIYEIKTWTGVPAPAPERTPRRKVVAGRDDRVTVTLRRRVDEPADDPPPLEFIDPKH